MTNKIMDEIRDSFRKGSTLTKLIYINLGVFLIVKIISTIYFLMTPAAPSLLGPIRSSRFSQDILQYVMQASDLNLVLSRPWTLLTYMFLHEGFLHILFNMLWLFWFGRIFLHYLTEKQLLTTYLLGGFSGAILFIVAYYIFPGLTSGIMLGASASVSAIVLAISFYNPNYTIRLFFIGEVKLKQLAIAFVILDVLQIAGDNPGGHIAHLGGAIYGYLFAMQMRKGKDLGRGFSAFSDAFVSMFKRKPKLKVTHRSQARSMNDLDYNKSKSESQKNVDIILDKIAKTGYNSLTKHEKEILFKMSDKK